MNYFESSCMVSLSLYKSYIVLWFNRLQESHGTNEPCPTKPLPFMLLRPTTQPSPILLVSFLVLDIYDFDTMVHIASTRTKLHDRLVERIFHLALIIPSTSFVVTVNSSWGLSEARQYHTIFLTVSHGFTGFLKQSSLQSCIPASHLRYIHHARHNQHLPKEA